MPTFRFRLLVMSGAIALMTSMAQAQDIPSSFDQLRVVVKPGDTVILTGSSGGVMQGRILDLSSATLALQVDGQRREFSAPTMCGRSLIHSTPILRRARNGA